MDREEFLPEYERLRAITPEAGEDVYKAAKEAQSRLVSKAFDDVRWVKEADGAAAVETACAKAANLIGWIGFGEDLTPSQVSPLFSGENPKKDLDGLRGILMGDPDAGRRQEEIDLERTAGEAGEKASSLVNVEGLDEKAASEARKAAAIKASNAEYMKYAKGLATYRDKFGDKAVEAYQYGAGPTPISDEDLAWASSLTDKEREANDYLRKVAEEWKRNGVVNGREIQYDSLGLPIGSSPVNDEAANAANDLLKAKREEILAAKAANEVKSGFARERLAFYAMALMPDLSEDGQELLKWAFKHPDVNPSRATQFDYRLQKDRENGAGENDFTLSKGLMLALDNPDASPETRRYAEEWYFLDKFTNLPQKDRQAITPILSGLRGYGNMADTAGGAAWNAFVRGFTDTAMGAVEGAESFIRRACVNSEDYQRQAEVWADVRNATEENAYSFEDALKKKDGTWGAVRGYVYDSIVGASGSLPYMAIAGTGPAGVVAIALQERQKMEDIVASQGGDVSSPEFMWQSALCAGAYAGVEYIAWEGLAGMFKTPEVARRGQIRLFQRLVAKEFMRDFAKFELTETLEEDIQDEIEQVFTDMKLDKPPEEMIRNAARTLYETTRQTLGSMAVTGAVGMGKRALTTNTRTARALEQDEIVRAMQARREVARMMEEREDRTMDASAVNMDEYERNLGDITLGYLESGGRRGNGLRFLTGLGFNETDAKAMASTIDTLWRSVNTSLEGDARDEAIRKALGGREQLSPEERIRARIPAARPVKPVKDGAGNVSGYDVDVGFRGKDGNVHTHKLHVTRSVAVQIDWNNEQAINELYERLKSDPNTKDEWGEGEEEGQIIGEVQHEVSAKGAEQFGVPVTANQKVVTRQDVGKRISDVVRDEANEEQKPAKKTFEDLKAMTAEERAALNDSLSNPLYARGHTKDGQMVLGIGDEDFAIAHESFHDFLDALVEAGELTPEERAAIGTDVNMDEEGLADLYEDLMRSLNPQDEAKRGRIENFLNRLNAWQEGKGSVLDAFRAERKREIDLGNDFFNQIANGNWRGVTWAKRNVKAGMEEEKAEATDRALLPSPADAATAEAPSSNAEQTEAKAPQEEKEGGGEVIDVATAGTEEQQEAAPADEVETWKVQLPDGTEIGGEVTVTDISNLVLPEGATNPLTKEEMRDLAMALVEAGPDAMRLNVDYNGVVQSPPWMLDVVRLVYDLGYGDRMREAAARGNWNLGGMTRPVVVERVAGGTDEETKAKVRSAYIDAAMAEIEARRQEREREKEAAAKAAAEAEAAQQQEQAKQGQEAQPTPKPSVTAKRMDFSYKADDYEKYTGDATGAAFLTLRNERGAVIPLPAGFADYWREYTKWRKAVNNGWQYHGQKAGPENRPRMQAFGVADTALADWCAAFLDGRTFDDAEVRFLFGRGALGARAVRGGGDSGNYLAELASLAPGLAGEVVENGDGTYDVDSFLDAALDAYRKYAEWRQGKSTARKEGREMLTAEERHWQEAEEEEEADRRDAIKAWDDAIQRGEAIDMDDIGAAIAQEYDNAVGFVYDERSEDWRPFDGENLSRLRDGDWVQWDGETEAFRFSGYDAVNGVLTITSEETGRTRTFEVTDDAILETTEENDNDRGQTETRPDDDLAGNAAGEGGAREEGGGAAGTEGDFALESATPEQIEAERERARVRAEIERRLNERIVGGVVNIQENFDLGDGGRGDLFEPTTRYSIVRDRDLKERLENGPTVKVYRAMQLVDGKLYPPMAGKVDGKWQDPVEFGQWIVADERPDLVKDGKFTLNKGNGKSIPAAYNPYWHTSRSPLNDQFSSAWVRPNLVTVECEVPESELTSGYKAEGAKDAVGEMSWHTGPVSSRLAKIGKPRLVILSRYVKVNRVVPDAEVADKVAEMLDGSGISIPENTVTPSLRAELERRGVVISPPKGLRYSLVTRAEDAAYMDAVSRGDMETAQEAVNKRVRELGGVFHRGKAPDATQYIVEFADDPTEILQYGEHQYALLPDQLTDVPDFVKDFALEYFAEDNGVSVDEMGDEEKERYRNSVLPSKIRDWADAWDRADFVSALWEIFSSEFEEMIDNGIVGFKTPDGAVAWPQEKAAYKIADPVTYDDAGNVIPLSERFNPQNEDIRYSLARRGDDSLSPRSYGANTYLTAMIATDILHGIDRSDAEYERLAANLHAKLPVADARDRAAQAIARDGRRVVREAVPREQMKRLAKGVEAAEMKNHLMDAATGGQRAGVDYGQIAERGAQRAKTNIRRDGAAQSSDYAEFLEHFGVDIAGMLTGRELDGPPADYPQAQKVQLFPVNVALDATTDERARALLAAFKAWRENQDVWMRDAMEKAGGEYLGQAFPIPPELMEKAGLDLNSSGDLAAFLKVAVCAWIAETEGVNASVERILSNPLYARRYAVTMARLLRDLAQKVMDPKNAFAARQVERAIASLEADEVTPESVEKRTAAVIRTVNVNAVRQTRKAIIKDLREQIHALAGVWEDSKIDELEKDENRRVLGHVARMAKFVSEAIGYGAVRTAKEIGKAQKRMEEAEKAVDLSGRTDITAADLESFRRAAQELLALEQYGGLKDKAPAEIQREGLRIIEWLKNEYAEHEARWDAYTRENDAIAQAYAAGAENPEPHASKRRGDRSAWRRFADDWNEINLSSFSDRLLLTIRNAKGDRAEAAQRSIDEMNYILNRAVQKCDAVIVNGENDLVKAIENAVEGTGMSPHDFYAHLNEKVDNEISLAITDMGDPAKGRRGQRHFNDGKTDSRLTWGQVLFNLAYLEQVQSYGRNIKLYGRENQAAYIRSVASSADLKFLRNMQSLMTQHWVETSRALYELTGFSIGAPDVFYFPVRTDNGAREGLDQEILGAYNPLAPYTARKMHSKDIDESRDIIEVYMESVRNDARVIAFGIDGMRLRSILTRKETIEAIIDGVGEYEAEKMRSQLTDIITGGRAIKQTSTDRLMRKLNSFATYTQLGTNLLSPAKQLVSIPAWAGFLPNGGRGVVRNILHFDWATAKELMEGDGFAARYGRYGWGMNEGWGHGMVARVLQDPRLSWWDKAKQLSMTPLQFCDFVPGIMVATGLYKTQYEALRDRGLSPAEAKERAQVYAWQGIEATQQSSQLQNLNEIFRRTGVVGAAVLKYANAPVLQQSHLWTAWRLLLANGSWDNWKTFGRVWAANHILMPCMMYAVTTGFRAMLGQEPPEEWRAELVTMMLLGSWGRVIFVGGILDAILRASAGLPQQTGGDIPAFDNARRVMIDAVGALGISNQFDAEKMGESLNELVQDLLPIVRQVETAVENWGL